jgi:predicted RNA-binding Zn-ribbon protein involved in translation (DUF1610 family)
MDSFLFNQELECRSCGYRFFMTGDRVFQYPSFCPECGETEVYRAPWDQDEDEGNDFFDHADFDGPGMTSMISYD